MQLQNTQMGVGMIAHTPMHTTHLCTPPTSELSASVCALAFAHVWPHLPTCTVALLQSMTAHLARTHASWFACSKDKHPGWAYTTLEQWKAWKRNQVPDGFLTFPPSFIPTTAADKIGGGWGPPNPENRPFAESDTFTADTFPRGSPAVNSNGCTNPTQPFTPHSRWT